MKLSPKTKKILGWAIFVVLGIAVIIGSIYAINKLRNRKRRNQPNAARYAEEFAYQVYAIEKQAENGGREMTKEEWKQVQDLLKMMESHGYTYYRNGDKVQLLPK